MRLPDPPLLIITDRSQAHAPLEEILSAAFAAGCRWASVREKDLEARELLALAARLRSVSRHWRAQLTLHGDPALAREAGLDGVHLPAGADAGAARALVGAGALVGVSLHTPAEARALDANVVDYAIAGPTYATASKPGYGPMLGPAGVGTIADATRVPVIAIGGITADRIADMRHAGAIGVAVMGGLMRAKDSARETRRLLAALCA